MMKRQGAEAVRFGSLLSDPHEGSGRPAEGAANRARLGAGVAIGWWTWPSLFALDAPTVAVVWLWAIGVETGHPVSLAATMLVAASVWLAYVADRLLDLRRLAAFSTQGAARPAVGDDHDVETPVRTSERHAFYAKHRGRFGHIWGWVLGGTVALGAVALSPVAFTLGLSVASLAVAAILWNDRSTLSGATGRHVAIGLAFAGAVAVGLDAPIDATLVAPLLAFAAVCASNLAWVAAWERRLDDGYATTPRARDLARAIAAAALLAVGAWWIAEPSALGVAAMGALLGCWVLEAIDGRRASQVRSAAADLMLVVPLLALLF